MLGEFDYLQRIHLCDTRNSRVVFVSSCSYLDSVWDKFSVWFYLLLVLGFMYAYPIYKGSV
jgi:hypothetical protein